MQTSHVTLSATAKKSIQPAWFPRVLLALLFCAAMLGRPASAQSGQQFVGHVEDSSHGSLAGATVVVHNEATGEEIFAKTTGAGDYTIPYVKIGTYTISVTMQGFKDISKTHITLATDQNSKIDFTLPVGNISETVTVNSAGSQIELTKADRGQIIDAEQVQELPTDGRNPLTLFALTPGSFNGHNPQFTRAEDNVGDKLFSNGLGQTAQENLDGASNDNATGFAVSFVPPMDSVAEFKVVLNPYDSSYGRAGGGAIDVSLKSGTNKIHGDIYDYWRRPWLDANSFANDYNNSLPNATLRSKPAHKRDQYGFEADGPVYIPHIYDGRDKTFFTIQYEYAKEDLPNGTKTSSIPNPQWLTGDFSNATFYNNVAKAVQPLNIYDPLQYIPGSTQLHLQFPGNIIPKTCTPTPPNTQCSSLNPVGLALAKYYLGTTPNTDPGTTVNQYQKNFFYPVVEHDLSRTALVKVDHNFGSRDRGTIRWGAYERYANQNGNGIPSSNPSNGIFTQIQPKDESFAIDEIHTFSPNFILDNKVNVNTVKLGLLNGVHGEFAGPLGYSSNYQNELVGLPHMFPDINTAPDSNHGNSLPDTGYVELGVGGPGNYTYNRTLTYQPSVTVVKGRHTIRAGFDMRLYQYAFPGGGSANPSLYFNTQYTQQQYNNDKLGGDPAGVITGNSIASLLIGDPVFGSLHYAVSPFYSQHYFAGWAQDDWKVTPKLTLNLGVRYDVLQAPTERHNKLNYAFDTTDVNTPIDSQVQALHPGAYCSVNPSASPGTCLSRAITGGIRFAGVNGAPRGAYATNFFHIQPRFGIAYAFSSRTSLRAGFGEQYINNNSNDSSNGFSSDSSYTKSSTSGSPNGNFEPLGNLADPYPATSTNPSGTLRPSGSSLGLATTPGSSVNFTNPNYQVPSIWEYSVSLEQLLSRRDTLDISYSGSREYNGEGNLNLNPKAAAYSAQCDYDRTGNPTSTDICDNAGSGPNQGKSANPFQGSNVTFVSSSYNTAATLSRGDLSRPFPEFTDITQGQSNVIHTWYNSMQVSFIHNVSKALTLKANYTWSKSMTAGNQIDATNGIYERKVDGNDHPNIISLSSVFYVPVGRGKALMGNTNRVVDALVGGWEISPLYIYTEGTPWSPGNNWIINGPIGIRAHDRQPDANHTYKRTQGVTPCVAYEKTQVVGGVSTVSVINGPTYTEAGCTSPLLIRTNGYAVQHNMEYTGVRHEAYHQFDASISKRFAWNERANLQLRLDAFNILNHPNFTNDYHNDPTAVDFGAIDKGPDGPSGLARDMQLSGKITF